MLKKIVILMLSLSTIYGEDAINLSRHEKSLYSEFGEDGILAKIFQIMPPKNKSFIHLGSSDGINKCSSYLLRLQGWKGLLIDRLYRNDEINLQKVYLTAENINQVLEKNNAPTELDLLIIDLHYNDFHIWDALDSSTNPSVIIVNYNSTMSGSEDKIVKYKLTYAGDTTDYFGASIYSLKLLGNAKGYGLVYAESGGEYLFFVRNDLLEANKFENVNDHEKLYKSAKKRYIKDTKTRSYTTYSELKG